MLLVAQTLFFAFIAVEGSELLPHLLAQADERGVNLGQADWAALLIVATAMTGVVGWFLRRLIIKQDEEIVKARKEVHSLRNDMNAFKMDYVVLKAELRGMFEKAGVSLENAHCLQKRGINNFQSSSDDSLQQ